MAETMSLTSTAFVDGDTIPVMYTCDGSDVSPELRWTEPPAGTKSFALIVDDPDAPKGLFTHWVLFDIAGAARGLAQGDHKIGRSGRNSFGKVGYGGPCPPRGHGTHRYYFTLYALDVDSLGLVEGADRAAVEAALAGHVLATAQLMGRYVREG